MIKKFFILFLLFSVSVSVYAVDPANLDISSQSVDINGNVVGSSTPGNASDINQSKAEENGLNSKTNTTPDTSSTDNILGISQDRLRTGNITYTDIPLMIVSAIEFLLGVAGSISVVALIYHAVRMQLASGITGDSSGVDKAKKGMYGAMFGFVLSMSGWFLMTKLVALLTSAT